MEAVQLGVLADTFGLALSKNDVSEELSRYHEWPASTESPAMRELCHVLAAWDDDHVSPSNSVFATTSALSINFSTPRRIGFWGSLNIHHQKRRSFDPLVLGDGCQ